MMSAYNRLKSSPWLLVFSSFILQMYSVGMEYTTGLLLVEITNETTAPESQVALLGSIHMGVFYSIGN